MLIKFTKINLHNEKNIKLQPCYSDRSSNKQQKASLNAFKKNSFNHSNSKDNKKNINEEKKKENNLYENDYSNNYIFTDKLPTEFIRNINNSTEGYPKLNKLHQLKKKQIKLHSTKPYGVRVPTYKIISKVNDWIYNYDLKFDVIMIGALVENQLILPLLLELPVHKLCDKPGFLFIWSTTQKIQELTKVMSSENFKEKFRRSEELIFLPTGKNSSYHPIEECDDQMDIPLFQKQQWHCWMCITGTVRRSLDNHLIHCNIDTDLQIESYDTKKLKKKKNAIPDSLYKVAENFSNSNKRLHIIPSKVGYNIYIKPRPGWVIMSPDILLDNFDPIIYEQELYSKSSIKYKKNTYTLNNDKSKIKSNENNRSPKFLVPQTDEIEKLRPKSPSILA